MFLRRLRSKPQKPAQSMVEFALVLPLLLLVIYGMLEVGRLLFMYSIVATASREAVRYGSATGLNVAGGVKRYKDCAGIRNAAQNVDFLGVIEDAAITIQYDHGPGTAVFSNCPPASVVNGDRITVQVTAQFVPLVAIVPLDPRTIRSSSARTILVNITVAGTALPPPTVAPPPPTDTFTPMPTFTPSFTPTATNDYTATPTLTSTATNDYTATPTFTPSLTLTPTLTITPTGTATITPIFSPTATPVNCYFVTHGPITYPATTMTMSIQNGTGSPLIVKTIFVEWNHDNGHKVGDKTLHLRSIVLAGVTIWIGDASGPSLTFSYVPSQNITLPIGASDIILIFNQTYDNAETTDRITIQFDNNGCASYTLDSAIP
jgi:Flp pilus assembly protein TadG